MLVVDGIELVAVNEPLKVRKLQCDHAVGRQQVRHFCGEIVEIRHLRQNVVADNQSCMLTLGDKLLRKLQAEELDQGGNALPAGGLGHVGGRFDARHRHAERQEMLQQISIVACDLEYPAV